MYLLASYLSSGPVPCSITHGCEIVRTSDYASFLGLPTPLYGVIFYFALGLLAMMCTPANASRLRWPLRILTLIGLVVSAWLSGIEAFVIHAWCLWCIISAILSLLAFLVVWVGRQECKFK